MIVHATFHIHPDNKEKAKAELRKIKAVIQKHGGAESQVLCVDDVRDPQSHVCL